MKSRIGRFREKRREIVWKLDSVRSQSHNVAWHQILAQERERYRAQLQKPEEFEGDHEWVRAHIEDLTKELSEFEQLPVQITGLEAELRRLTRVIKALGYARSSRHLKDVEDSFPDERPSRKQKGWHDTYVPTRSRYWRPADNNWKCHRKSQHR